MSRLEQLPPHVLANVLRGDLFALVAVAHASRALHRHVLGTEQCRCDHVRPTDRWEHPHRTTAFWTHWKLLSSRDAWLPLQRFVGMAHSLIVLYLAQHHLPWYDGTMRWRATSHFQKAFHRACAQGDGPAVRFLTSMCGVDPGAYDNAAIRAASAQGRAEVVRHLLRSPRVNPAVSRNRPLRDASAAGHLAVVDLLLQSGKVDAGDMSNDALRKARRNGHMEVMRRLLQEPGVDDVMRNEFAGPAQRALNRLQQNALPAQRREMRFTGLSHITSPSASYALGGRPLLALQWD